MAHEKDYNFIEKLYERYEFLNEVPELKRAENPFLKTFFPKMKHKKDVIAYCLKAGA
jgi:hypothetical protein